MPVFEQRKFGTAAITDSTMIKTKRFAKVLGNDDSRPLAECHAWALEHCVQTSDGAEEMYTPMLIFAIQRCLPNRPQAVPIREFVATTLDSFFSFYSHMSSDAERHCDEVICLGPCKAYCDFEIEFVDEKIARFGYASVADLLADYNMSSLAALRTALDASSDRLIQHIVQYHRDEHEMDVRPFISTAHKKTKWSRHVVFVGSLWTNAIHVGTFMKRLARNVQLNDPLVRLYLDTQVYGRNRSFRMWRSSKPKEPDRSLLREGESPVFPVDEQTLLDSLITVIPLPPPLVQIDGDDNNNDADHEDTAEASCIHYMTSAYFQRFPELLRTFGMHPIEDPDARNQLLLNGSREAAGGPTPLTHAFADACKAYFEAEMPSAFDWQERTAIVVIRCKSRTCAIVGGAHESQQIYLEVNVLRNMYRQCCHSVRCHRRPTQWQPLGAELATLCQEFLPHWRFYRKFGTLASYVSGNSLASIVDDHGV